MRPACSRETLLLLWEHECLWVYGHRMVNDVDWDRYKQTYFRAVKKKFSNEEQVRARRNNTTAGRYNRL